jgi:hypothetical protein
MLYIIIYYNMEYILLILFIYSSLSLISSLSLRDRQLLNTADPMQVSIQLIQVIK